MHSMLARGPPCRLRCRLELLHRRDEIRQRTDVLADRHSGSRHLRRSSCHENLACFGRGEWLAVFYFGATLQAGDRAGNDGRGARGAGEAVGVPGFLVAAALRIAVAQRGDMPSPALNADDLAVVREPDARARNADFGVAGEESPEAEVVKEVGGRNARP